MLTQILVSLFGQTIRPLERQDLTIPVDTILNSEKKASAKYEDDVKALHEKYGEFITGLCIEITLQELLKICPRKRARIEAYQGLRSYLQNQYGVSLNIKSRKSKIQ